jgi:integrase
MDNFALDINKPSLSSRDFKRSLGDKRETNGETKVPVKRSKRRSLRLKNKCIFTEGFIQTLTPSATRQRYYDQKVQGLLIEVMPAGSKVFRFRRKVDNTAQWATIGKYPAIGLEDARNKAILLNAELVKGIDFIEQRQQSRNELTLGQLVDIYFNQYAEGRLTTAKEIRADISRWFTEELPLKLSQADSSALQACLKRLAADGKFHSANKARNYIRAIINWGAKKSLCGTTCVEAVKSLDGFKVKSRERFVQSHEFGPLLTAIDNYPDPRIRDFFLMCLWTGARSGNVMAMRWDQIDLDVGTWHIDRTKNGDSQTIGLSDAALSILRKRHKERSTLPFVFPGGNPQNKMPIYNHLTEPKKAWKKIITAAGLIDLRIHDLRRTAGSVMAIAGVNTAIIQKALGHKSLAAAAIYQRVNNDPVRRSMNQAIETMQKHAKMQKVHKLKINKTG